MNTTLANVTHRTRPFLAPGLLVLVAIAMLATPGAARAGAALHIVNSTGDQPDAVSDTLCDVDLVTSGLQCTLRAAFQELVAGTTVNFNIPGCPPACTIHPATVLPPLANNNEINGTTQPGYSGTPLITIDGTGLNGPGISLGTSTIGIIRGLRIQNVDDDHGIVGGAVHSFEISDSIISGSAGAGVALYPPLSPPPVTLSVRIYDSAFNGNINGILAGTPGQPFNYAEISGSKFLDNTNRGVEMYLNGFLHFNDNAVSGNDAGGAYMIGSSQGGIVTASINDNVFDDNVANGITTGATSNMTFTGNTLHGNTGWGADLSNRIPDALTVTDNVIRENSGNGLVASATGTATLTGNTITQNGGNGANVTYEQYVGSGTPPPAAMTVTDNHFTNNFGTGLHATDNFLNFSLNASRNTFSGNTQGLYTSAYSLGVTDSSFSGFATALTSIDPAATGIIAQNTFVQNGTAISQNSAGVTVNFNRIVGNNLGVVHSGLGISNATNNWWGCNEGPFHQTCDSIGQAVDGGPWLILTPSAAPASILTGQTSTITAGLTLNSDSLSAGAVWTAGQGSYHIPNGTIVQFETDLGSIAGSAPTSGGVAGATLQANGGPGTAHVEIGLDSELVTVNVVISQAPTVTPTPTGAPQLKHGDLNCSGAVTALDALLPILQSAGLSLPTRPSHCPPLTQVVGGSQFGDVDCNGAIGGPDSLAVVAHVGGTPLDREGGCPAIGQVIS